MAIRVLEPSLVSRIAAGEVVERPASVVKELLDNSVDAGADRVSVAVERGGISCIEVGDNGCGMTPEDAVLCLEQHATSKIGSHDDLHEIRTLGFRGEALASISAVSRIEIRTRIVENPSGSLVRIEGAGKPIIEETGCPVGTTVSVRDLFFNVPARRKFLKTEGTEIRHISEGVIRHALAHERVHYSLKHGSRGLLDLPRMESRFDRIASVLGSRTAEAMIPVFHESTSMAITGFLSRPGHQRRTADQVYFLVNDRYVQSRLLLSALLRGCENVFPVRHYPLVVLYLTLEPRMVDVNVHPMKLEVRFADESRVFSLLSGAVRHALAAPPGAGPGVVPAQGPAGETETSRSRIPDENSSSAPPPLVDPKDRIPLEEASASKTEHSETATRPDLASSLKERIRERIREFESAGAHKKEPPRPAGGTEKGSAPAPAEPAPANRLPAERRILGDLLKTYVLCETAKGLLLIDIHAAHERITYEELRAKSVSGVSESQPLLFPHAVELPLADRGILEENREFLNRIGFELEHFGGNTFLVHRIPAGFQLDEVQPILRELSTDLRESGQATSWDQLKERMLITLSCHKAVRSGDRIDRADMEDLIRRLKGCPNRDTCPHGRPTWIEIPRGEIEKWFKRSGF